MKKLFILFGVLMTFMSCCVGTTTQGDADSTTVDSTTVDSVVVEVVDSL